MKNYRLKTSEGVRDYLGNEALLKEKVETNVRNFLLHYGYELVKTPTFEYVGFGFSTYNSASAVSTAVKFCKFASYFTT